MLPDNIVIREDPAEALKEFIKANNFSRICCLTDENSERYCLPEIRDIFPNLFLVQIPSGEGNKTIQTCISIWEQMTRGELDRKSLLINLGGGVIGDMGGFCASTYKRGIAFVQVPTTLLAQVDASVGGKLGIDFEHYKNHIGVFREPDAVFIGSNFLQTLPEDELRSGFAEVIKHCLIADQAKWEEIRQNPLHKQNFKDLARHSVEIKAEVVRKDPTEKGLRKILNFGHTLGHAVESYFMNHPEKALLHGNAVAIGMVGEAWISHQLNKISETDLNIIKDYICSVFGQITLQEKEIAELVPLTLQDKKNENGEIQCTLLEKPGKASYNNPVTPENLKEALRFYSK